MATFTCQRCGVDTPRRSNQQKFCTGCRRRSRTEYNGRWREERRLLGQPPEPPLSKVCSSCGQLLSASAFPRSSVTPDGLQSRCRSCNTAKNRQRASERANLPITVLEKECLRCHRVLATDKFNRHPLGRHGLQSRCKECASEVRSETQSSRRSSLRLKFGLTLEDYELLLDQQNGRCAICGSDSPGTFVSFVVDHNHATGVVRGLLCSHCNSGLGYFRDNSEFMRAAIAYLAKDGESHE